MITTVLITVALPVIVFILLARRYAKDRGADWKLAACLSALAIITSLLGLLSSGKVVEVSFKDSLIKIRKDVEESQKLAEQTKRIARLTAELVASSADRRIDSEPLHEKRFLQNLESLLKESGASGAEIDQILGGTNSVAH